MRAAECVACLCLRPSRLGVGSFSGVDSMLPAALVFSCFTREGSSFKFNELVQLVYKPERAPSLLAIC